MNRCKCLRGPGEKVSEMVVMHRVASRVKKRVCNSGDVVMEDEDVVEPVTKVAT
jgi:hypothetical protein